MSGTGSLPDDPDRSLEELLAEHRDAPPPRPPEEPITPENAGPLSLADLFDPSSPLTARVASAGERAAVIGEVAGEAAQTERESGSDLPDAPLFALLRTVEAGVEVDRIDRIWVFPPRRLEVGETSVVVVAAYPELEQDRRRVYAAQYTVTAEVREPRLALDEYGTAPTDRVGRLVEEVVERIKDGPTGAPKSHRIEGSRDRWHTVLHELAEAYLEEVRGNPRLRR